MKKIDKTKVQLLKELEETKKLVQQLNGCQAEFEKARAKYEQLLESTPDAMLFVNTQNEIVLVNAQFEKVFGYSQDEIAGQKLDILLPQRYKKNHSKMVQSFFEHPKTRAMGAPLEIYAIKKDGTEFSADISLSPLQTDEELLATAAVRDITERKRAKEELEASEEKYRKLFDHSLSGIGIFKGNKAIAANEALLDIFGYTDLEEFIKIPVNNPVKSHGRSPGTYHGQDNPNKSCHVRYPAGSQESTHESKRQGKHRVLKFDHFKQYGDFFQHCFWQY